jgi:ABC-2 type transport system permease protein
VRRRDAVLAKAAAVAGEIAIVWLVGFVTLAALNVVVGLDLEYSRLAGALTGLAVIGLLYGWLALAMGAAVPSRVLAIALPAGYAAAAYLVSGLHNLAGWLDPFRFLSPFWLVGSAPLQNGVDGWGVLVVVATAVAALAAGSVLVDRRDLETP